MLITAGFSSDAAFKVPMLKLFTSLFSQVLKVIRRLSYVYYVCL